MNSQNIFRSCLSGGHLHVIVNLFSNCCYFCFAENQHIKKFKQKSFWYLNGYNVGILKQYFYIL